MTQNISDGLELYKQFLFHYQNWIEVWLLENPVNRFLSIDEYLNAFYIANLSRISSMQERYALNKETVELFTKLLKPKENGRKCISVIR